MRDGLSQKFVWFFQALSIATVSEVYYVKATYSVEDPFVHAIVAEEGDCVFLATVLVLVYHKEESGPVMMYCLLGLLSDMP